MRQSSHAGGGPRHMPSHAGGGAFPGGVGGIPPGLFRGGASLFGDGAYSGNIIQGGSALQPQAYSFYETHPVSAAQAISSGHHTSYVEANAFDAELSQSNNPAYLWIAPVDGLNHYLGQNFGTPKTVSRVRMLPNNDLSSGATQVKVQFSSDGSTWNDAGTFTTSWPAENVMDFAPQTAQYWRVYSTAMSGTFFCIANLAFENLVELPDCIVVTGVATVAPDSGTGASAFSCRNLVVSGASATLAPSTNSKGLVGFVSGRVYVRNSGRIHIDKLGKAGNFGNLTVFDLTPDSIKRKLKNDLAAFVALGEGAAGQPRASQGTVSGVNGVAATLPMQSGGGGTGNAWNSIHGASGKGGPCSGGAGSGGTQSTYPTGTDDAGDYGGPGSAGVDRSGGGAGDAVGGVVSIGYGVGSVGEGAGGGLLMLFTSALSIASGCIVSADGAKGGGGSVSSGGSAGGGIVCIVTRSGGYVNNGTVRASGGAAALGGTGVYGGAGGAGSVNTFTV